MLRQALLEQWAIQNWPCANFSELQELTTPLSKDLLHMCCEQKTLPSNRGDRHPPLWSERHLCFTKQSPPSLWTCLRHRVRGSPSVATERWGGTSPSSHSSSLSLGLFSVQCSESTMIIGKQPIKPIISSLSVSTILSPLFFGIKARIIWKASLMAGIAISVWASLVWILTHPPNCFNITNAKRR